MKSKSNEWLKFTLMLLVQTSYYLVRPVRDAAMARMANAAVTPVALQILCVSGALATADGVCADASVAVVLGVCARAGGSGAARRVRPRAGAAGLGRQSAPRLARVALGRQRQRVERQRERCKQQCQQELFR